MAINGWNAAYAEQMYQAWLADRTSVPADWHPFFMGYSLGAGSANGHSLHANGSAANSTTAALERERTRVEAMGLTAHYRVFGHTVAHLDPLSEPADDPRFHDPTRFGITPEEHEVEVDGRPHGIAGTIKVGELHQMLRQTYCGSIGVQFMHIENEEERRWLISKMEPTRNRTAFRADEKAHILLMLLKAEAFERFMHENYVGQKRFSLEGGESLIPLLDDITEQAARNGVKEVVMGMAHRGRLNVLANILRKPYGMIFAEFEDHPDEGTSVAGGDVKYHMGFTVDVQTRGEGRKIHLTMTVNPSHLEMVGPVVQGRARAKQHLNHGGDRKAVLPIVMHGDAALPGQGVVMETFNFSQLEGFTTGGTIHIVINNQVGFTTSMRDSRSTRYCTEVAKVVQAPIIHVNGDDPEAVVHVGRIAAEWRQKFARDIVIDLVCYRKWGHNEGDEPTFTQPVMYRKIRAKKSVREMYVDRLLAEGSIDQRTFDEHNKAFTQALENARKAAASREIGKHKDAFAQGWTGYKAEWSDEATDTTFPEARLRELGAAINTLPPDFAANATVKRVLDGRAKSIAEGKGLDWATAEALAFASLLDEGFHVRLTGQDVRRGTFSQRHASLFDANTEREHVTFSAVATKASFQVYDSPLSEFSIVAFEYGYSLVSPMSLVLWEAQFGDFANCAQAVIDEYVSSAEFKWQRHSGLVLLLPHGYEGQGPDHSSARMERFLQLCAQNNMQVCCMTTPAQYFHVLRRQMKMQCRKPLVIPTPKSMLRHPLAKSTVAELASGSFQEVIADASVDAAKVTRVLFSTGKVYWELLEKREAAKLGHIALVRVEQLYPYPEARLKAALALYPAAKELVWVQEEPKNNGAWSFLAPQLAESFGRPVACVSRPASASPATGSKKTHDKEQERLLKQALDIA
jgi:2-oxoglutarate dehydrogenase E1 component